MDEQALIQAASKGDLGAFNRLVLSYQGLAYNLAYRILGNAPAAEDATQESFLKAYTNLKSYRGGSFKAWLLRIVTNTCYDQLRFIQRRPSRSLEEVTADGEEHTRHLVDHAERPPDYALRQELGTLLQEAIDQLSPDQRITVLLSDVEGFSYEEIAQIMATSLGTVKSRLSRGRAKLRLFLRERQELLPGRYRLKGD